MLPVCCLRLPGLIIKKLHDAGFLYAEDVVLLNDEIHSEAEKIISSDPDLKAVLTDCLKEPKCNSASDLLQGGQKPEKILTFSYRLDKLLGGGVPLGALIEVCGAPGSGKTQLWLIQKKMLTDADCCNGICVLFTLLPTAADLQLCASTQLHSHLAGLQAEALYIDTDAGFSPQRLQEIGQGCREHCCKVAKINRFPPDVVKFLEKQSFKEYYYMSILDYPQLLATVFTLDTFIQKHRKVKLVIIDSLPFPFLALTDMLKRTMLLCKILQQLKRIAFQYNVSVVMTNHLTTRISRGENQLIPALGECVGYLMDYRLMLGYLPTEQHFAGVIFKSPISQNDSAEFQITGGGIRDIQ